MRRVLHNIMSPTGSDPEAQQGRENVSQAEF
jgi:hypothetical protein